LDNIGKNLIFCGGEGDNAAVASVLIGLPLARLASVLGSGFDRVDLQQLPQCKLGQFSGVLLFGWVGVSLL